MPDPLARTTDLALAHLLPDDVPGISGCDPRQIRYYGCTRCQRSHFEGAPLFEAHLMWQSKHSIQCMSREAYLRLVTRSN